MTSFLQVKDNASTRAIDGSLNNTTNPITLNSIDTTRFDAVTTGYIVTIWDDVTYPDPGDDPNMEKAFVSAATIAENGSFTLARPNAVAHPGTPRIALLVMSQHINEITTAINAAEADIALKANIIDLSAVATTGSYNDLSDKPTIPTVPVLSVAGRIGDVVLDKSDVGLSNVDNTSNITERAASALLTNKSLDDATTYFVDTTDPTKRVILNVPAGQTTGTTRTVSLPSQDSSLATLALAEVLSSKTLSAPQVTGNAALGLSATLSAYNTSDQTTNYERLRTYWSSNTAYITTENGGTGAIRGLYVGIANAQRGLNITAAGSTIGRYQLLENTGTTNAVGTVIQMNSSAAGGTSVGLDLIGTSTQTSAAGYTMLRINSTETTVGTGTKLLVDAQVGGVSLSSIDSTGTLNLIAAAATMSNYNIGNQTATNYERVRQYWSGNIFNIGMEKGGTGVDRAFNISTGAAMTVGSGAANTTYTNTSTTAKILNTFSSGTGAAGVVGISNVGTFTGSAGTQYAFGISPVVNQSSTAGYTALLVNSTETATGSGTKLLADFQVGGTSKVSIKNDGVIFPVQAVTASAPTYVKGGIYFDTTLNKLRVGGVSGWETITSA